MTTDTYPEVVLFAGGGGGARMAEGLAQALPPGALTVVANVGDDDSFYGLRVSPDIDSLLYTLAERIDRSQGWGVDGDSGRVQAMLGQLGAPVWMRLGDADLGMHIWRTWRLNQGASLTEVTLEACQRMGIRSRILPVTDHTITTRIITDNGPLNFQEWFVRDRCRPRVTGVVYRGGAEARPSEQVLSALTRADLIVLAPSNPLLSIEPMMIMPELSHALATRQVPCIAVSPLIGTHAVKGPLTQMLADLSLAPSVHTITARYQGLIDGMVIDNSNAEDAEALQSTGLRVLITDILMSSRLQSGQLAGTLLTVAQSIPRPTGHEPL